MMMHAFETLMRNECNYTGTMPWWDEQKDADSGNFFGSNMWDADTGFGGNGTGPDGCLTEGPFANTTEHIGPMLEYTTYCQKRIWDNEYGITTGNSTLINLCNSYETYGDFWYCIVRGPLFSFGYDLSLGFLLTLVSPVVLASPRSPHCNRRSYG